MAAELPQRDRELIDQVLDDFRRWAPREAQRPVFAGELRGGHSHRTVLLRGERRRWVLRVARQPLPRDACHDRERQIQQTAAAAGLAPPVLLADPGQGLLLCPFVDDRGGRESPAELAALLRQIHALPARGPRLSIGSRVLDLVAAPGDGEFRLLLKRHRSQLLTLGGELEHSSHSPTLCHNDLLRANRRRSPQGLLALDWEYACSGDPYFDLAVVASELDVSDAAELLARYLDRTPSPREWQHWQNCRRAYAVIAAGWYAEHEPGELADALDALRHMLEN